MASFERVRLWELASLAEPILGPLEEHPPSATSTTAMHATVVTRFMLSPTRPGTSARQERCARAIWRRVPKVPSAAKRTNIARSLPYVRSRSKLKRLL